jgi:hypothetical protein
VSVRLVGHADVPDAATALLTLIDGVVRGDDRFDAGRWPTAIGAFADRARGDLIPADRPREVSPSSEAPRDTSA